MGTSTNQHWTTSSAGDKHKYTKIYTMCYFQFRSTKSTYKAVVNLGLQKKTFAKHQTDPETTWLGSELLTAQPRCRPENCQILSDHPITAQKVVNDNDNGDDVNDKVNDNGDDDISRLLSVSYLQVLSPGFHHFGVFVMLQCKDIFYLLNISHSKHLQARHFVRQLGIVVGDVVKDVCYRNHHGWGSDLVLIGAVKHRVGGFHEAISHHKCHHLVIEFQALTFWPINKEQMNEMKCQ